MGAEKFKNSKFEEEEIMIPKKNFKDKVDKIIEEKNEVEVEKNETEDDEAGLNLFDIEEEKEIKKTSISIYFEEEDLQLLKAVSKVKNTTVNKMVKNILKASIDRTRTNLPDDFDVLKKAKEYDKMNKNKGKKAKTTK